MTPTQTRPQAPQPTKKLPTFEVIELKPVEQGNLLAFVAVRIGRDPTAITVREFRLVQQPGQAAWVASPQRSWIDEATGQRRYTNLFEFPREWRQPLTNTIITAWEEHQREGGAR